MLEATRQIEEFVAGFEYTRFAEDRRTASAVVRQLEILGEAASRIPTEVRDRYPHIPWRGMISMRNRLIHGYFGVDLAIVWDTAVRFVPQVHPELERILHVELGEEDV